MPYTIVHATQFFEFVDTLADSATVDGSVRMPPAYFQPMAAADVAEGVARAALDAPVDGIVEIGGPHAVLLPDLIRTALTARGDKRPVIADPDAKYWGLTSVSGPWCRVPQRGCPPRGSRTGCSARPPLGDGVAVSIDSARQHRNHTRWCPMSSPEPSLRGRTASARSSMS